MARWLFALLAAAALAFGQRSTFTGNLDFEQPATGDAPEAWGGGPAGTVFEDTKTVHAGHGALRIDRNADSQNNFSTATRCGPVDFTGETIVFRGWIRSEGVTNYTGLWMREDGASEQALPGAFADMQKDQIKGSTEWTEYSISLPLHPEASRFCFGFLLAGMGQAWADDLELTVDGKPIAQAPVRPPPPPGPLEQDHEFDAGSGIQLSSLAGIQITNLATLGKVWGYLKYHHPAVTGGEHHWDYELFRVLPRVLAATDRAGANAAMLAWIDAMGPLPPCDPCAQLEDTNLYMGPDLAWLRDEAMLGPALSASLRHIQANRPANGGQYFLSLVNGVGNPAFAHEPSYTGVAFPDPGYQLLGLYRFWNMVAYWSPYRDLIEVDWDGVLMRFVPRVALAPGLRDYRLEMVQAIGQMTDSHANVWNVPNTERPPAGACQLPAVLRFLGRDLVVSGYADPELGPGTGLLAGDVIETMDGTPIAGLIERYAPYYPASNETTLLRDLSQALRRGACANVKLGIRRGGAASEVTAVRVRADRLDPRAGSTHDRPGDTFQMLADDVAYLKLSAIKAADVPDYIRRAAGAKGLIIDIRNYPSEFMVFTLGRLLVDDATAFARFTAGDLGNPGAFYWRGDPLRLEPQTPHYAGKVMVLVDESSQSQAEYTAMAFRASPRATVIGSTTAGADGNVSQFSLPGGLNGVITGIGVFYPDKSPTQRIGILPDVRVVPTIEGIRAGRDELVEEAIRRIRATP